MKIALTAEPASSAVMSSNTWIAWAHLCAAGIAPRATQAVLTKSPKLNGSKGTWARLGARRTASSGCDAVVHAAVTGRAPVFGGAEGEIVDFVEKNVVGDAEADRRPLARRCRSLHHLLDVRASTIRFSGIDHLMKRIRCGPKPTPGPTKQPSKSLSTVTGWPGLPVCVRDDRPASTVLPDWLNKANGTIFVSAVVRRETVQCSGGGKEVHVADVAKAVGIFVDRGWDQPAKHTIAMTDTSPNSKSRPSLDASGSNVQIMGESKEPKHQIMTDKIQKLGMDFGGHNLLTQTIELFWSAGGPNKEVATGLAARSRRRRVCIVAQFCPW